MQNLNGTEGSVSIIGAVSPQGGDFSEPVTQNTKRFVRCFWGLDKSLAYARHFPAIHWLTSYSEYLEDLTPWYREHVSPKFVADRNQLMAILNQESSLMEIVKLIGADVLPEIAYALDGQIPILADGCVRSGVDALKLMALGANGVLVGRPLCWGAYGGGSQGVATVLQTYTQQLYQAMIMTGCPDLSSIDGNILY